MIVDDLVSDQLDLEVMVMVLAYAAALKARPRRLLMIPVGGHRSSGIGHRLAITTIGIYNVTF